MTDEQLRKVPSSPESRCTDARKCRLAAFGAALRNRSYDTEEDGPTVMLDRALRAILHTKSLVGPLEKYEIDFFAEWLGRAYRSKSRLLGFGADRIPVDEKSPSCIHQEDGTPKHILGTRRLPGKQELPRGTFFETDFQEVDDFLRPERGEDGKLIPPNPSKRSRRKSASPAKRPVTVPVSPTSPETKPVVVVKRKPGRPRKIKQPVDVEPPPLTAPVPEQPPPTTPTPEPPVAGRLRLKRRRETSTRRRRSATVLEAKVNNLKTDQNKTPNQQHLDGTNLGGGTPIPSKVAQTGRLSGTKRKSRHPDTSNEGLQDGNGNQAEKDEH